MRFIVPTNEKLKVNYMYLTMLILKAKIHANPLIINSISPKAKLKR